jgi:CheY-like chemotaxis protein
MRVLVVDDNKEAREILCDVLRGFSLRADSVSSGEEAIQRVASDDSQDPYSVVLMDWHMPGMDGLEASRLIIRGGNLKHVPKVVMVTAFGREDIRTQAEEIGLAGYLLKPVSPSLLYDTFAELFGVLEPEGGRLRPKREDTRSADVSGIRILLVEDNEINRQVATELLESAGANVRIAKHGSEAVSILTQGEELPPFDVVLMDLQMPEMDGFTATGQIRAQPRLQGLPIIAMTAHALVEERQRCLEAGMNDHVSKPIDPDALFATLTRWAKPVQKHAAGIVAAPAKAADEVVLPEIDGINVRDGLARVAGNQRRYKDLLMRFAVDQCNVGAQISAALESGDSKVAERIAHSLKGVAGNMSITKIFSSAGSLERAIRERDPAVPALLREFRSLVDHQIHAIRQALPDTSTQHARTDLNRDFDAREASSAARRLRELLEESDGGSKEAFSAFTHAVSSVVDKPELDALEMAIKEFDFDSALSKLNEIVQMPELSEPPNE